MRHPILSEARSVARGEEFTDDHIFGGGSGYTSLCARTIVRTLLLGCRTP